MRWPRLVVMLVLLVYPKAVQAVDVYDKSVSVLGSALVPVGDLSNISETGYGIMAQFGTWTGPGHRLQGVFGLGYHSFGEKSVGQEGRLSFKGTLVPVEAGANYFLGELGRLRPYVTGRFAFAFKGQGFVHNRFGLVGGAGLDIPMQEGRWSILVGGDFYLIFHDETSTYVSLKAGFVWQL